MAGATNRALKAAGIPKATIATLRVEHGSGLSLRSALGIAHERGLPVGKAAEFHAAREAKHAASPAGQAAAADFRAKAATALKAAGERKAAMLAERQKRVAGTVRALGKGMLAQRKAAAAAKAEAARKAAAPKREATLDGLRQAMLEVGHNPRIWRGKKEERVYLKSPALRGSPYVEIYKGKASVTADRTVDTARIRKELRAAGFEVE
jgi:hypothetical protein